MVDLSNAIHAILSQSLGRHNLSAGEHVLRFECRAKSEKFKGFYLGFNTLLHKKLAYARPADLDLRKIQATSQP